MGLSTIWVLKLKQKVEEELELHENIFREMKKQKHQLYLHQVTQSVPVPPASPSSFSYTSAILGTARPTTPVPPPPQLT